MSTVTHITESKRPEGGFVFDNCIRNSHLKDRGLVEPKAQKTGTTICGLVFPGGVVLGADTRATEGPVVADKNCEKIHYIAPNVYCCGAGTSADTENTTEMISSQCKLMRLNSGRETRVSSVMTQLKHYLFKYQGYVSAALVLGGVDATGPHLYSIWPAGSVDKLPFVTMGSGSLAAMAEFEAGYKDDLTEEEAKALVHRAISAGVFNDLGSGGNIDLCVLKKGKTEYLRGYDKPNERMYRAPVGFSFPRGTTEVLTEEIIPLKKLVTVEEEVVSGQDTAMED